MMKAEVVHHIAGRMRLRVPALKGDGMRLEEIRGALRKVSGVRDVSANPALGTLVISYEPSLYGEQVQHVTEHALGAELFLLRPPPEQEEDDPAVSKLDGAVDHFFGKANRMLEGATGHAVNLKEVFPFGIVLYALLFVDKAIAASQWMSWIQFAISTYLEVHEGEPIARVGDSVDALREEVQALRKELQSHLEKNRTG